MTATLELNASELYDVKEALHTYFNALQENATDKELEAINHLEHKVLEAYYLLKGIN